MKTGLVIPQNHFISSRAQFKIYKDHCVPGGREGVRAQEEHQAQTFVKLYS